MVHDVSIKTSDVIVPQQTLFLLILPRTFCIMGQGGGQVPAVFKCSVFVAEGENHNWSLNSRNPWAADPYTKNTELWNWERRGSTEHYLSCLVKLLNWDLNLQKL